MQVCANLGDHFVAQRLRDQRPVGYKWMLNLPKPSDCSDPVMRSLNISSTDVLTFGAGWFEKDDNITNFQNQFTVLSATSLTSEKQSSSKPSVMQPKTIYIEVTDHDCAYEIQSSDLEKLTTYFELSEDEYRVVEDRSAVTLAVVSPPDHMD